MKILSLILHLLPPAISATNNQNNNQHSCEGRNAQFFNHDDPSKPNTIVLEKNCGHCCCNNELNHLDCGTKKLATWKTPKIMEDRDYTHVYLNENKLQNISSISPSASLRSIQAAENRLEASFSLSDLLHFPNLEYLTLRHNSVSRLTPLGSPHNKLAALDFSKNEIKKLENGTFEGLVALRWIDLANNQIEIFDKVFLDTPRVNFLNMSHNALEFLEPGIFDGLASLQILDLASNSLKKIKPHSFAALHSLASLDLRNNRIAHIDGAAFDGLKKLEHLDLRGNWLSHIDPKVFLPLPIGVKNQIRLEENPFECSCELRHMVSYATRYPLRFTSAHKLSCTISQDGEHVEKELYRLQSSEICDWLGELRNMIIAPLAVLLTIFVGIIVFFCRRSSKYAQSQITEVTRAYDVDSIGTFSDLKGDFSDHTHSTQVPQMYFHRPIQLPASLMPQTEPLAKPSLAIPIDIAPTKPVVSRPKLRNGAFNFKLENKKGCF
jgi:hypothetical protein